VFSVIVESIHLPFQTTARVVKNKLSRTLSGAIVNPAELFNANETSKHFGIDLLLSEARFPALRCFRKLS
jgi:hypothetical protein